MLTKLLRRDRKVLRKLQAGQRLQLIAEPGESFRWYLRSTQGLEHVAADIVERLRLAGFVARTGETDVVTPTDWLISAAGVDSLAASPAEAA